MSTKLNAERREVILRMLLDHAFDKRKKDMAAREAALFLRAVDDYYGAADIKRIQRLPKTWFEARDSLYVCAGGYALQLTGKKHIAMPRKPPRSTEGGIKDAALIADIQLFAQDREAMRDERARLSAAIVSLLSRVTTVEKLYEAMPEAQTILASVVWATATNGTSVAVTAKSVSCGIAKARGEERADCVDATP